MRETGNADGELALIRGGSAATPSVAVPTRGAERSGTRKSRKMPDTTKATIATTIASRSVDSAGAPEGGLTCGKSVNPAIAV